MKTLLFSKQMACAWAHGDKNQTRRALSLKLQDNLIFSRIGKGDEWIGWWWNTQRQVTPEQIKYHHVLANKAYGPGTGIRCPYGVTGDKVRLLTTWAVHKNYDDLSPNELPDNLKVWSYFDGHKKPELFGRIRMGRYIPKEGARRRVFYKLFDSLNKGKGISAQKNGWVWVIGLKKIYQW